MAIRDAIGSKVESGILFEGTYGLEIEAESLKSQPFNLMGEEVDTQSFTFWNVKNDDSLRHYGKEYVMKAPMFYEDLNEALTEFTFKTKKIKFIQDSISTSVHVHVNMLPETWVTMANFLTIYTLIENLLIEYSGEFRRNNLFCLPIRSVPHISKLCTEIFIYVKSRQFNFKRQLDLDQIKYAALNLSTLYRFGSVELRSFRGVTDIPTIQSWVDLVNDILVFSRQKITPPTIMDAYKDKGIDFLREVFGDRWKLLDHVDRDKLLKQNLWYAGTLAYMMDEEQWTLLDHTPEPAEADIEGLDIVAHKIYGQSFMSLDKDSREVCLSVYENETKASKIKKTSAHWIDFLTQSPPGDLVTIITDEEPDWLSETEEEDF